MFVDDSDGTDLAQDQFNAACDQTSPTSVQFAAPSAFAGALSVHAWGMGSANTATVRLYVRTSQNN